jgi:hypothetical protein
LACHKIGNAIPDLAFFFLMFFDSVIKRALKADKFAFVKFPPRNHRFKVVPSDAIAASEGLAFGCCGCKALGEPGLFIRRRNNLITALVRRETRHVDEEAE